MCAERERSERVAAQRERVSLALAIPEDAFAELGADELHVGRASGGVEGECFEERHERFAR